ncbi:hypothetical protein G9A89_009307 [Geosiphon pyriformis]|nr:hypothetical protein G9A89_009307 [Geosiphon pyriformis]
MFMEPNYNKEWKTVVYRTKKHVLFVQALDIPEKIMRKKVGWIYNLLGDAKEILTSKEIESFLMATDDITNQMAGQRKVLVKNILLGISDKKVEAAMKEFGKIKNVQIKVAGKWQLAVVEYNNQEKTELNQLLYFTTFTQQPPDFEYLNHQIHIWVAAYQSTITLLETEEESYQTAPIYDLFLSESEHSTQTVTPEPMAQDPMQGNILAVLQGIQTALGQRNNTPLLLFRAATVNQYDNEYKFQIVSGYFQGSPATWFLQKTNAGAQQKIVRWIPANIEKNNTSFTTWFENKFRIPILISKWHMELEKRTQGLGEVVTEYAKAIRKLIKHVDSGRNWTEEQKIYSFTKGLRTNLLYALWPFLALKNNPTMDMTIKLTQRIEDNQRMHLESTLPVFAPAPVMASTH